MYLLYVTVTYLVSHELQVRDGQARPRHRQGQIRHGKGPIGRSRLRPATPCYDESAESASTRGSNDHMIRQHGWDCGVTPLFLDPSYGTTHAPVLGAW